MSAWFWSQWKCPFLIWSFYGNLQAAWYSPVCAVGIQECPEINGWFTSAFSNIIMLVISHFCILWFWTRNYLVKPVQWNTARADKVMRVKKVPQEAHISWISGGCGGDRGYCWPESFAELTVSSSPIKKKKKSTGGFISSGQQEIFWYVAFTYFLSFFHQ